MTSPPSTIRAARVLLILNALIWFALGAIISVGAHPSFREMDLLRVGMAVSTLLTAAVLTVLIGLLGRRSRPAYWLVVAALAGMSVLTVLDQFGLPDLAFLVLTLLALILLIRDRAWYLRADFESEQAA